ELAGRRVAALRARVPKSWTQNRHNRRRAAARQGRLIPSCLACLCESRLIGTARFELATPCSQSGPPRCPWLSVVGRFGLFKRLWPVGGVAGPPSFSTAA